MVSPVTTQNSAVTLLAVVKVITGQQKVAVWTLMSAPSQTPPVHCLRFAKTAQDPLNAFSLLPAQDQAPLPDLSCSTVDTLFVPQAQTALLGAMGL